MRKSQPRRTNANSDRVTRSTYFYGLSLFVIMALAIVSASVLTRASGSSGKSSSASTHRTNPRVRLANPKAVTGNGVVRNALAPMAAITVDRTDDAAGASACTAAGTDCSLRGAVAFANSNPGT